MGFRSFNGSFFSPPAELLVAVEAILWLLTAAVLVPMAMFCLECLLACWPGPIQRRFWRSTTGPRSGDPLATDDLDRRLRSETDQTLRLEPTVVILIPAHNEQRVLGNTLARLVPHLTPQQRVLVVADHCTDRTAAIAHEWEVEVILRANSPLRGKSYALDYGVRWLKQSPPDVVLFLDADCAVEPNLVSVLAAESYHRHRPVQGRNLSDPAGATSPMSGLSALAFQFKNLVRPLGVAVMQGPSHLTGTGMALPWELVKEIDWATGHLAEDMHLGVQLAIKGVPAVFCPQVGISSRLPVGERAFVQQRTRWEQGHLRTLITQTPRLLREAFRQRRADLFIMGLDLAIPPLALLVTCWLGLLLVSATLAGLTGVGIVSTGALIGGGTGLLISLLAGWWTYCRHSIRVQTLLLTPLYLLRKLPIYVQFLTGRGERRWLRTSRDTMESSSLTANGDLSSDNPTVPMVKTTSDSNSDTRTDATTEQSINPTGIVRGEGTVAVEKSATKEGPAPERRSMTDGTPPDPEGNVPTNLPASDQDH